MNFIPVKRCNPYLSRRIGDVIGYVPHNYYNEILDSIFSGTVESWSDLPSNVQDIIIQAENAKRFSMEQNDVIKKNTLQRIDEIKTQLNGIKTQLESEKSVKIIARNETLQNSKEHLLNLKNITEVDYV